MVAILENGRYSR